MEYPLCPAQELFYTEKLTKGIPVWNEAFLVMYDGNADDSKLDSVLNETIAENEILHTVFFTDGKRTYQRITEYECKKFEKVRFENKRDLLSYLQKKTNEYIDISVSPINCIICRLPDKYGFFLCAHHIVCDGYSVMVTIEKFSQKLGLSDKNENGLSLGEYVENADKYKSTAKYENDKAYWQNKLSEEFSASVFFKDTVGYDYSSSEYRRKIKSDYIVKAKSFCEEKDILFSAFIYAVFGVCISRNTGLSDFSVGMPVLNRFSPGDRATISLYMHILPLIFHIDENDCFNDIVEKTFDNVVNLMRHQRFTQTDMQKNFPEKMHNLFFDVTLDYQTKAQNGFELDMLYPNFLSSSLEIHLMALNDCEIELTVRYRNRFFGYDEIVSLISSFEELISSAVSFPDKTVSKIPAFPENEIKKALSFSCGERAELPEKATIYSIFEKNALENKEKICLEYESGNMTYSDFLEKVTRLDMRIRSITPDEQSVVAVMCDRSPELYISAYAILRGNNIYLPVSTEYPEERVRFILKNSGAKLLLIQSEYDNDRFDIQKVLVDLNYDAYASENIFAERSSETGCAYVITTSGTTGAPKFAMVSNISAVNRILWMQKKYPLSENSVILQKTPVSFDVSIWEFFWWGMCGGKMGILPPKAHFSHRIIAACIKKFGITHIHFVPSVFAVFLKMLEENPEEIKSLGTLEHIFLSGESLMAESVNRFHKFENLSGVKIHNLYGPAECAVDVTFYDCAENESDPLPIGMPITNTQIYILDKYQNILPVGKTGEIYIGGMNVGLGYLNAQALTSERFIINPFGEGRLYKTGDLAYRNDNGQIVFCSRCDDQIKLNGQRIELGEIEAVISQHKNIENAIVLVRRHNERDFLISYFTGDIISSKELKSLCRKKLPAYMIPTAFVHLDSLPLNSSGKLDRKLLEGLDIPESEFSVGFEEPKNQTERKICEAYKKVLNIKAVDRNTDFYDVGGTSLDIIVLLSDEMFKDINASDFIGNSTPSKLAKLMAKKEASSFKKLQRLDDTQNTKKALVLFPYAGGTSAGFSALTRELIKADGSLSVYYSDYPEETAECDEIAEEVIKLSESIEVSFYAHCVGSAVALQVAEIIEKKNPSAVKSIIIGGNIPPKKAAKFNIWNAVPDSVLVEILKKAGSALYRLPDEAKKTLLADFRRNTDYAVEYFGTSKQKLNIPIRIIISKMDLFTKNYKHAETSWKNYSNDVAVSFIDSKSHYFQSDSADVTAGMIAAIIK